MPQFATSGTTRGLEPGSRRAAFGVPRASPGGGPRARARRRHDDGRQFSLVNGILLEPLPYLEPNRLAADAYRSATPGAGGGPVRCHGHALPEPGERVRRDRKQRFDDGDLGASEAGQNAVRVRGARVTASFFDVLGVPPAPRQGFAPGDRPGAAVVVLSHRIWRNAFTATPMPSVDRSW